MINYILISGVIFLWHLSFKKVLGVGILQVLYWGIFNEPLKVLYAVIVLYIFASLAAGSLHGAFKTLFYQPDTLHFMGSTGETNYFTNPLGKKFKQTGTTLNQPSDSIRSFKEPKLVLKSFSGQVSNDASFFIFSLFIAPILLYFLHIFLILSYPGLYNAFSAEHPELFGGVVLKLSDSSGDSGILHTYYEGFKSGQWTLGLLFLLTIVWVVFFGIFIYFKYGDYDGKTADLQQKYIEAQKTIEPWQEFDATVSGLYPIAVKNYFNGYNHKVGETDRTTKTASRFYKAFLLEVSVKGSTFYGSIYLANKDPLVDDFEFLEKEAEQRLEQALKNKERLKVFVLPDYSLALSENKAFYSQYLSKLDTNNIYAGKYERPVFARELAQLLHENKSSTEFENFSGDFKSESLKISHREKTYIIYWEEEGKNIRILENK